MLDGDPDSLGILVPRMIEVHRDAISNPANELVVYRTTRPKGFYYYDALEWTTVAGSGKRYIAEPHEGGK
jgi:hypothetical protein